MKLAFTASLVLTLAAGPVRAALGQYEASVNLDRQILHGVDREEVRQGYKIHQITNDDGSVVKEFVSPAGLVFGIAWQAPRMPNLQQLLGSNMAELQVAMQSGTRRHTRGPLIVRTNNLVFVSAGHLRSFHGYAYVPTLVPANVSPEVVE